jgi:hypothetical protein
LLNRVAIKELLANADLSIRDKLLLCLTEEPLAPRKVSEVRELAVALGLRAAKTWNISRYLAAAGTLAIRTTEGWELTAAGKAHVASVSGPLLPSVTSLVVSSLRKQLPGITSEATKAFVEETIKALEAHLYRSAIVLSWVGAVSVLYDHVTTQCLAVFNTEATRRDPKWKTATNSDDLTRMKEFEFLQLLAAISVIGKNVKDELEVCLKFRNGCGHPNSLIVGEHKASAHIETLIQNVYTRF